MGKSTSSASGHFFFIPCDAGSTCKNRAQSVYRQLRVLPTVPPLSPPPPQFTAALKMSVTGFFCQVANTIDFESRDVVFVDYDDFEKEMAPSS